MTGMSASSQAPAPTGAAPCTRFAAEPAPTVKPRAMKISSADTFRPASTFITRRPGPTPRTWIQAISPIAASATIACREIVSGTNGSGMTRSGVASFAAGTKRPT